MNAALVVLAAGASSRLGEPKALVDLGGRSALERLLAAGSGVTGAAPLVVTGAHDAEIAESLPAGVERLENPDWRSGRTGGLARAVAVRPGLDLVVAPVDCPLVPSSVFDALSRAWDDAGRPSRGWLAPRHGDRHGHPVVIGHALAAEIADLSPGDSLRALRRGAEPLWAVAVDALEVLDDLDSPEDLARLRSRLAE